MSGLSLDSLDPGALAHKLVDSFLPKDMQWVGGLVGALVDYECGNELGAAAQAASALSDMKDIPQSSSASKPAANAPTAAATKPAASSTQAAASQQWEFEPSPPQPRVTTTVTTTTTTTTSSSPSPSVASSAPTALAAGTSKAIPADRSASKAPAPTSTPAGPDVVLPTKPFMLTGSSASLMSQLEAYVKAQSAAASTKSPGPGASSTTPAPTAPTGDPPLGATKLMSIGDINQAYLKSHPVATAPANGNAPAQTSAPKSPPPGAPPAAPKSPPAGAPPAASPTWRAAPPSSATMTTTTTTTTVTSGSSSPPVQQAGWKVPVAELKTASDKAGANGASASNPAPKPAPSETSKASNGASKPTSTEASSRPSTVDPSTLSKENFMKLSDDDLMKAVRGGKIPSDVTDSNEGMLALQARMNHISEMNQMMTTMMQSMHQMKMSVIENLKA